MRFRHRAVVLGVVLVGVMAALPAVAAVRLPAVIGSNMVLQRDMAVPIWGWATPGEKVVVEMAGQTEHSYAGSDGAWCVRLKAMAAGGPYTMKVSGSSAITLNNVMVGEVWVCSGQSNMQMAVVSSKDAEKEIAAAGYPSIRLFQARLVSALTPQQDTFGSWQPCAPGNVGGFTAAGYFFGRELHKYLGVPIGLIETAWGGTPAESWTSSSFLAGSFEYKPILDRWNDILAKYPAAIEQYNNVTIPEWQKAAAKAKAEGKEAPRRPDPPTGPGNPWIPASLFNGMIAPLIPYAIRGAIWYQGESNADRAYQYRSLFPDMIRSWRAAWGQGAFPFYFVQLANFLKTDSEPADYPWAELREAQLMTLHLPNTGQAVAIDIGDAADIHPKNKQEVGRRLALLALAEDYGQNVIPSGPVPAHWEVEGARARVWFWYAENALVGDPDGSVKGFAIAGEDRKFVWANARIDGGAVIVWSDKVPHPVAVRYAWANNPVCNLYNTAGLPATPFRTDDWPGVTIDKR